MAKARKIERPASLDTAYVPPEDASPAELNAMIEQVRADAKKLVDPDSRAEGTHEERVAMANWYIAAIEAMQNRQTEINAAAEAEAQALAEINSRLGGGDTTGDDEGTDGDAEGDAGVSATGDQGAVDPTAGIAVDQGVLVAGAGTARRSAVAAAASAGLSAGAALGLRDRTSDPKAYLTAAAGISGQQAGDTIDFDRFGRLADSTFASLPKRPGSPVSKLGIGTVHVPTVDERLVASALSGSDLADVDKAIEWAVSMERLRQEHGADTDSLVAAGWCAPSETLYDLVDMSTTDGMVNLPGITVTRGGVRFALGPDFTTVYNAGFLFTQTEAQNIAGNTKPLVNIPCPTFTDHRMNVDGLYLTGDILSQKGYPEAYADYTRKALTAYAHYVNAASIADMVAGSTAVDFTSGTKPTLALTTDLLGSIELQVTDMRYKNRLSMTNVIEVVLPFWLRGALRSDLAKRLGVENGANITDAALDTYFAARGVNCQWVYDWQDAFTGVSGGFGGATIPVAWPVTAKFLIYPQGTFVRALSDVIELSAVYDSTLLATNQFVALFMEQARLTLKRSFDARVCTIPVTVSGATAAGIDYTVVGRQPTV